MLKIARILTTRTGMALNRLIAHMRPHNGPMPYFIVSLLDYGYVKICTKKKDSKPSVVVIKDPVFYRRFKGSFDRHGQCVVIR